MGTARLAGPDSAYIPTTGLDGQLSSSHYWADDRWPRRFGARVDAKHTVFYRSCIENLTAEAVTNTQTYALAIARYITYRKRTELINHNFRQL